MQLQRQQPELDSVAMVTAATLKDGGWRRWGVFGPSAAEKRGS